MYTYLYFSLIHKFLFWPVCVCAKIGIYMYIYTPLGVANNDLIKEAMNTITKNNHSAHTNNLKGT